MRSTFTTTRPLTGKEQKALDTLDRMRMPTLCAKILAEGEAVAPRRSGRSGRNSYHRDAMHILNEGEYGKVRLTQIEHVWYPHDSGRFVWICTGIVVPILGYWHVALGQGEQCQGQYSEIRLMDDMTWRTCTRNCACSYCAEWNRVDKTVPLWAQPTKRHDSKITPLAQHTWTPKQGKPITTYRTTMAEIELDPPIGHHPRKD